MRYLVLVCALFQAQVLTVHAEGNLCSHITDGSLSDCIQSYDCSDTGNSFSIWENCTVGEELFIVDDPSILRSDPSVECDGYLVLADNKVNISLGRELDAERTEERPISCTISVGSQIPTYILPLDINEFSPRPQDGSYASETNLKENLAHTEVCSFTYIDDDKGETETLTISSVSPEFQEQFEMTQESNVFTLLTKNALDYETRSAYKLEFDIISIDGLGTEKKTTHTVLLFVIDVGDTKPYWLRRVPTASILEGEEGRSVYYVRAADRDSGINNKIKYSITKGNDDGFFHIDEVEGNVTLAKEIDHETDPTFFTLTVTAQEYTEDGKMAPPPSADETITNINIDDENDNSPTFNSKVYSKTIDEAYDKLVLIDLDMFVDDPDSAANFNQFTIISDCEDLDISPTEGRGNTSVKLYAQPKTDGVFDFEKTGEESITITLTATEKDDPSHRQSVTVNIRLNDKNDHPPIFNSDLYDVSVKESSKKGDEVVVIEAYDGDKSDLYGKASIRYYSVNCTNTLAVDDSSGKVTLAQDNAFDYEKEQDVCCAMEARDAQGDVEYLHANSFIHITVTDVNDSPPTIAVQNGTIIENSKKGTPLDIEISASDPDTTASLSFSIQWKRSNAYKDGIAVIIEKVNTWFVIDKIEDGGIAKAVLSVGTGKVDREVADTLRLSVMVTDDETASGYQDNDSEFLEIKISDVNDTPPEFVGDYTDLKVLENSLEGTKIAVITASDADENDAVRFSIDEETYFRIERETDFSAALIVSGKANIDREERETVQVTITIEDKKSNSIQQTFTVTVLDENDNPPIYQDEILFATFTPYDVGKSLLVFKADDKDQNENLKYQMANDFEWPDGGPVPPPKVPFTVRIKEGNDAELLLNFDPLGVDSGYCTFSVICLDNNDKHNASVQAKVYAITSEFEVAVIYDNPRTDTMNQYIAIQKTFEEVYGFPCFIDSIDEGEDEAKSVVKMHFIDDGKNEPVQASRIIEMSNVYSVSQDIISKNKELGLNIQSIGNITPDSGGSVNGVLILEILLGVVSFVLGSLLMLLIITYFIRTRSLERKLKVATTTTFGSVASDLNRMDVGSGVPGSNKFAGEGANPMYNLSESYLRNDDSSSIGSGDSVLVGVEDNPEFREYSSEANKAPKGQSNPAFSRSIDDVAAPSPFSGGTRTNPLMGMDIDGEDGDLADALHNYELSLRRQSFGSEAVSGESDGAYENSNFSFGNKM